MLVDIIRAILERVLRDKLILGLIIIGILGIFVTGANKDPGKDRLVSNQEEEAAGSEQKPGQQKGQAAAGQGQRGSHPAQTGAARAHRQGSAEGQRATDCGRGAWLEAPEAGSDGPSLARGQSQGTNFPFP